MYVKRQAQLPSAITALGFCRASFRTLRVPITVSKAPRYHLDYYQTIISIDGSDVCPSHSFLLPSLIFLIAPRLSFVSKRVASFMQGMHVRHPQ
jgi:hypothetical protein